MIEESMYEVEEILDKKTINGRTYYQIKWKGYPVEQSTWEIQSNLKFVKELIKEFQEANGKQKSECPTEEQVIEDLKPVEKEDINQEEGESVNQSSSVQQLEPIKKNRSEVDESLQEQALKRLAKYNLNKIQFEREVEREITKKQKLIAKKDQSSKKPKFKPNKKEIKPKDRKIKENRTEFEKNMYFKSLRKQFEKPSEKKHKRHSISSSNSSSSLLKNHKKAESPKRKKNSIKLGTSNILKIRLLQADENLSDIKEYLVEYQNGKIKVMGSFDLVKLHTFEFIEYLQKKAHKKDP